MVKGVFFDVGGTLYSYDRYPAVMTSVCNQVVDRFSLSDSVSELLAHLSSATRKTDEKLSGQKFYLFGTYFEQIATEFLISVAPAFTEEDISLCSAEMEQGLMNQLELKSDCHQTLASIKDRGLYTSVVSNSDIHQLDRLIERSNLAPYFDHITSSEAARSCKPDRKFFELALEKSGLKASDVLFVGDSVEQDIAGARDVGMQTALISDGGTIVPMQIGAVEIEPDFRVSTLTEILALL